YSFSVISQPPPLPSTKRMPLSAPQTSILPAWTFQPLRSLPLKSGVKPLGTSSSPPQRGEGTKARLASSTNHKSLETGVSFKERAKPGIRAFLPGKCQEKTPRRLSPWPDPLQWRYETIHAEIENPPGDRDARRRGL